MKKIGFIGIGKLGLDCAEVMAEKHEVRGYDIYPRSSDTVKVCDIDELVNESEWIFIAVPTPHAEGYDGSVPSSHMTPKDFGHDAVIDAINKVNQHAKTSKKVVLISTVLPGTTRAKFVPLLDSKHQFLYNPYLIAMGSVKWDKHNLDMVADTIIASVTRLKKTEQWTTGFDPAPLTYINQRRWEDDAGQQQATARRVI